MRANEKVFMGFGQNTEGEVMIESLSTISEQHFGWDQSWENWEKQIWSPSGSIL